MTTTRMLLTLLGEVFVLLELFVGLPACLYLLYWAMHP